LYFFSSFCVLCPMLHVSLACPCLIVPVVVNNDYFKKISFFFYPIDISKCLNVPQHNKMHHHIMTHKFIVPSTACLAHI
jgi:hypothetical protein